MTDSNITSFDYRRKSLGELQRQQEQLVREVKSIHDKNDWQEMYIDSLELTFQEFKQQHEFMVTSLLDELKRMNNAIDKMKGLKDGN